MKLSKMTMPVILTIVLGLGLVACTGETTKKDKHTGLEYYRSLQFSETPYDNEKGTHQITAEEAKLVNNYKFNYDDNGRLLSVEFVRNDVLLGYSSMGAAKIEYDYIDNKQIKHFFNKDNEPIESGGAFVAEYTLDENGIRKGLMFKDKEGVMIENRNSIHNYTWSILDNGMVQEKRYNMAGEEVVMNPFCPFYELRFSYNEDGYVTRMANYMGDTLYNCTAENCGESGVSYFLFEANEKGDLESFSVFNVYGQMSNLYSGWSKRLNKLDENGYVIETAVYDQDDEYVAGNSIPVFQRVYDSHGSVIEVRNMDKDRNIKNHPESGVAITEYKYDETGYRTETIRYDKEKVEVKI